MYSEISQSEMVMKRIRIIFLLSLVIILFFVGRLVQIQGIDRSGLADRALNERLHKQIIFAPRGNIIDSNRKILAINTPRYNIAIAPESVKPFSRIEDTGSSSEKVDISIAQAVSELAQILDLDQKETFDKISKGGKFSYIKKVVTVEDKEKIDALGNPWVYIENTHSRLYPFGDIGGNVLGFMGTPTPDEDVSLAGLELFYNDILRGENGYRISEIGADGIIIPNTAIEEQKSVSGQNIQISLDSNMQLIAQNAANDSVAENGSEWTTIVVMEVATSRVVAIAESGSLDPNNFSEASPENRGVRSIGHIVEPGSTTKVITAAAILEEKIANPNTQLHVPYSYTIGEETFTDSFNHGGSNLTLTGVLAQSSNTGTLMLGQQLSREKRYEYLSKFGFGSVTGIDLPGESPGILGNPNSWDRRQEYTVLFGQGVAATSLQTANVFNTVANGGILSQPRIADYYIDSSGEKILVDHPEGTRIISAGTAQQLKDMLEVSVSKNGGTGASVPGYRVAGKTGTAEAVSDSGGYSGYTASFAGFAPADNPQYTIAVTVQRPKTEIWGETIASPIFSKVMSETLRMKGVPLSVGSPPDLPINF